MLMGLMGRSTPAMERAVSACGLKGASPFATSQRSAQNGLDDMFAKESSSFFWIATGMPFSRRRDLH